MNSATSFQIASTCIFILAICHMFLTPTLYQLSLKFSVKQKLFPDLWKHYHFLSEVAYLSSEVELVFGIWLIPLFLFSIYFNGWENALSYVNTRNYNYALYIAVVLVVIGSRPIITFAENILERIARLGKDSPGAWWWTILFVAPLLGSIIKEPAAMALAAILLSKKFYPYQPSKLFQYATLGLLFANISVGGTLTKFASRALFIVAYQREWDPGYMLVKFGWKAAAGMLVATSLYYVLFRKEFATVFPKKLPTLEKGESDLPTPFWITFIHLLFFILVVISSEFSALLIAIFILFVGFWRATSFYQSALDLRAAILIAFFFAALLIHGELQSWWVLPLMSRISNFSAMSISFILSALMDNAIVSYITLEIPEFDDLKHYLVVTGAMSAGGLTLVANAPNLIGHSVLQPSFRHHLSFLGLFLGAIVPSLIFLFFFWMFQ